MKDPRRSKREYAVRLRLNEHHSIFLRSKIWSLRTHSTPKSARQQVEPSQCIDEVLHVFPHAFYLLTGFGGQIRRDGLYVLPPLERLPHQCSCRVEPCYLTGLRIQNGGAIRVGHGPKTRILFTHHGISRHFHRATSVDEHELSRESDNHKTDS